MGSGAAAEATAEPMVQGGDALPPLPPPPPRPRMRLRRYYTPDEVRAHNSPDDAWVSLLGSVYDVTPVLRAAPGRAAAPLLAAAGTDVSHWFDAATGDVRARVDPETQLRVPYTPQGAFPHVPPMWPTSAANAGSAGAPPWWRDPALRLGALSAAPLRVAVRNVLTAQEHTLVVPAEETAAEVAERYREACNAHAGSYVWKALVPARAGAAAAAARRRGGGSAGGGGGLAAEWVELDMGLSLADNGVPGAAGRGSDDGGCEGEGGGNDDDAPVLHVYWTDDLTVA